MFWSWGMGYHFSIKDFTGADDPSSKFKGFIHETSKNMSKMPR
jgi:hypothetical protein